MGRTARDKNDAYRPAPVKRIDVNFKNSKGRLIMVALCLAIAAVAFSIFAMSALGKDTGWTEIELNAAVDQSCANDFTVKYNLGYSGAGASAEYRAVRAVYQQAAEKGYILFHPTQEFEGTVNLATIQNHPNESFQVDPVLYEALEKLGDEDNRLLYLAPIYAEYNNLFFCAYDHEAERFDPERSEETAAYFRDICAFINDPDSIQIRLENDHRVTLQVSQKYLDFAKENGMEQLLDLGWTRNAFLCDYLAESLEKSGHVYCTVSSKDGYSRVLDPTGTEYGAPVMDYAGKGTFQAASLGLSEPAATVSLHTYDLYNTGYYYAYEDGTLRSAFIDPADGGNHPTFQDLLIYQRGGSCADAVAALCQNFVSGKLDRNALLDAAELGIHTVFCSKDLAGNHEIRYTEAEAQFVNIYTSTSLTYDLHPIFE